MATQDTLALIIVAGAVVLLVRRFLKKRGCCESKSCKKPETSPKQSGASPEQESASFEV
jgi:hypothetical protein